MRKRFESMPVVDPAAKEQWPCRVSDREAAMASVNAVCGWPMSHWRLMKTVERGATLARIFNLREGFSRPDDILPERFFNPPPDGPLKDSGIDSKEFNAAREIYYQMMGWDPEGVPTYARLVELGIEWAEGYIDRKG